MTISTTSNTVVAQGNGLTTSFSFSFPVPLASELFVYLTNAGSAPVLLSPSQYSVTGIGSQVGGAVTYPLVGSPIPVGSTLTIQRVVSYQQLTDLVNQSGYYPNVVENALDYLTMQTQQLAQLVMLSLQVPLAATQPNLTLPSATGRAGQLVGFDALGNAITYPITASVGAGNLKVEGPFVAGTAFTPGVTATLTLSQNYGSVANVGVHFDTNYQGPDQYTLSGNNIIFTSPIPVGVTNVYVIGGTTLSVGVPANGTVGTAQLQAGAVTAAILAAGSVGDVAIAPASNLYSHVYAFTGSKDYGATGNGVTDDRSALLSANNIAAGEGTELVFTPGNYLIGSSIAFTAPARFLPGAKLTIPTGVTVAFNGGVSGPIAQIFACTGTGAVTINGAITPNGYAEWWGAQSGNTGVNNAPFIMAAHVALVNVNLMAAIYYTTTTVQLTASGHSVNGASRAIVAGNTVASQIIIQSATLDVMLIGPSSQPGTITQTNTGLFNVTLGRSVAPNVASTPAGLRTQFCIWPHIDNIYTYDGRYGYVFTGTAEAHVGTINASRYTAGVGGSDQFYGVLIDGSANIGYAGGNASLYIEKVVVGSTISIADSQGVVASGTYGYSDTFLDRIETANLNIGVQLIGNGNTGAYDDRNEDVHIGTIILDTCAIAGIQFTNTSLYGAIRVAGGFIAFAASAASPTGIIYSGSKGKIEVTGVQVNCGTNTTANAVVATNSDGINQHDNLLIECASAIAVLQVTSTSNSRFADDISNEQASGGSVPAVEVTNGCVRNVFDMQIRGGASKFSVGYYLSDTTSGYNEFKCSRMNPGALSTTNKISYNGTAITSPGSFGTSNLASGIMN